MLKYRMPAEWEKHEGTILSWPHLKSDWPGKFEPIPWVYTEIVKKLSFGEKVYIIIDPKLKKKSILSMLEMNEVNLDNVEFIPIANNRGWSRDNAPAFVYTPKDKVKAIRFKFNGWAKYKNYQKDKYIPEEVANHLNIGMKDAIYHERLVVLEGGAIDVNGKGTLITTEECLMDQETQVRNKDFSKYNYENVFAEYLGITNVLWLGKGIAGDDTHGHVDDLCRFTDEKTLVIVSEDNPDDENYAILKENYERAQDFMLEDGSKPNVVKLPMPRPIVFDGMRLPASYANFYIGNEVVLVPTFNDKNDRIALNILADLFPGREVVGISAIDLIWGLGTLHCLTHEVPAFKVKSES